MGRTTARTVSHEATAERDGFFTSVLDGLPDAVIAADGAGMIRYVNAAAERLLGWDAAELVGRPLGAIQPPHLRDACLAGVRHYRASGQSDVVGRTVRLPAVRRDGTEIDVDLALATIGEPERDGGLLFVATLRLPAAATPHERELIDLLARETAARARIQALAAERTAVLGQIADGVMIADTDGRVIFLNDAAARLYGVDVTGTPIERHAEVYHLCTMDGRPYPPGELPLARAALHGETVIDAEWRIRRPDGAEVIAQGSAAPVIAEDGTRLGAVLTLRDITVQRELERSRADFIATASHDLKTPLTSIKGWAQLLLQRAGDDPARGRDAAALTAIVAQANTMQRLIDQLLDASRLQLGQEEPLRPRWVNLVGLARRLVAEHQALTERHELRLTASAERIVGVWDADRVEQIVANLLSNAVKYSPHGGLIAVTVDSDGRDARVAVRDHGLGIPAADLPRIFDRSYRVARHAAAGILGTGLGLFSALRLARRMGGRIEVASDEGVGSTFTLVLPLERAPPHEATARPDGRE